MFKSLTSKIHRDFDYPPRQFEIDMLTRVLDGSLYDHLHFDFNQEKREGLGEYIPIRERRPSVRYGLCRIVVDDSVSLLFSEGHFPIVDCRDEKTRKGLLALVKETRLNEVMIEAATIGSVGSVAILMRVLDSRVFFSALSTMYLTPVWKKTAPDTLEKIVEQYKVRGSTLLAQGYEIEEKDLSADFWFRREWDENAETWYFPWKVLTETKLTAPVVDEENTTRHNLGFVPVVWVKNLPGGNDIDGKCTFPVEAIDTQIEIDYQLSQAGRGLKYSSDPTLLIKEPAADNDGKLVKGGGNAIVVGPDGDAKLLEINGAASAAVIDYVRCLREMALESAHGNRSNADKLSAAQSGRAMELMNQSLVWLADRLRINYGEGALLELLRMAVKASQKYDLVLKNGTKLGKLSDKLPISLRWPAWYQSTSDDAQKKSTTLTTLVQSGIISEETATKAIAGDYDIEDEKAERTQIEKEQKAKEAKAG